MNDSLCRTIPAPGDPLRILFGQPAFSSEFGWDEVLAHFPVDLAERTTVETVDHHELSPRLLAGPAHAPTPDVVVPIGSALTRQALRDSTFGLVQQFGVGVDSIDLAAATDHRVWVANMPGLNAPHVAEHALALLLALAKRLPEAADGFVPGAWGSPPTRSLRGARAVVVGLGAVGAAVARLLHAFGAHVTGVRRNLAADPPVPGMAMTADLHGALTGAELVVLAATPVPGAAPLMDTAALQRLAPGALLVNVARGAVLDEDAALAALRSGRLAGLGVDVFGVEPYPQDGPLLGHPGVVATSHTAALTSGYFADAARALGESLARHLQGLPPLHPVNALH